MLWPTHLISELSRVAPQAQAGPTQPARVAVACARGGVRSFPADAPLPAPSSFGAYGFPQYVYPSSASSVPLVTGVWHECCPLAWLAGLVPWRGAVVCEWVWGEAMKRAGAALPSP